MRVRKVVPQTPSPELQAKITRAAKAVRNQSRRSIKCPYCRHTGLVVFSDARGHVETKCKYCDEVVVVDVLNMRRLREPQRAIR